MSEKSFDFYYDFGSPNAYVVHKLIPTIEQRTGARAIYRPIYLAGVFKATGNVAPGLSGVKGKVEYLMRELERFAEHHDIALHWTKHFPLATVQVMRAAILARGTSWDGDFVNAVFDAAWAQGLNISDAETMASVLTRAGLPLQDFVAGIDREDAKSALFAATEAAVARGVFGVPSIFVGDDMYFGKQVLDEVEAALMAA